MIIDTMVMAYAVLGVPGFGQESLAALSKVDEISAPASVEAELLNVIWQWGKRGVALEIAQAVYENASRLWTRLIPVEAVWSTSLELALTHGHSPYDTLFVATARYCNTKVLTYDQRLLTLFPHDTTAVQG
jgi:predicted nucleic acid-binding protein